MSDLTQEQYDQLPDFIKTDYQEVDGAYKHAGVLKMKDTLNGLDSKLKARESEFSQLNDRLTGFEEAKAKEIEEAKAKALEEAKSKGDVEAIEARYQEQMADLAKREREAGRLEAQKEFTVQAAKSKADAELTEIVAALKPVNDGAAKLIRAFLATKQQVTDDGKIIYLNDDGSASSLDKSGFLAEQVKSDMFDHVRAAPETSKGGGKTNGSKVAASSQTANQKAESAKAKGDSLSYLKAALGN